MPYANKSQDFGRPLLTRQNLVATVAAAASETPMTSETTMASEAAVTAKTAMAAKTPPAAKMTEVFEIAAMTEKALMPAAKIRVASVSTVMPEAFEHFNPCRHEQGSIYVLRYHNIRSRYGSMG
jgi:hypothetical protein